MKSTHGNEQRDEQRDSMRRRRFLEIAPAAAGALWLAAEMLPTPASVVAGAPGGSGGALGRDGMAVGEAPGQPTVPTTYGPFYRKGAPYRAKVSPPLAVGMPLVMSGRIWGIDTKRPIEGARMEVWQVDHQGRYSDGTTDLSYRARLISAEDGGYEFESIHPVGYKPSPDFTRSAHIHFKVEAAGYRPLVSEFFFEGDPMHEQDPLFRRELLAPVRRHGSEGRSWESAVFDIVLERA